MNLPRVYWIYRDNNLVLTAITNFLYNFYIISKFCVNRIKSANRSNNIHKHKRYTLKTKMDTKGPQNLDTNNA